jgi:hypothetical protein
LDWSRVSQGMEIWAERKSSKWGMHKGTIRAVRRTPLLQLEPFLISFRRSGTRAGIKSSAYIYAPQGWQEIYLYAVPAPNLLQVGRANYLKEASLDDRLSPINRACDWPSLVFDAIARPKIPPSECDLYVTRKTCGNATPV